MARSAARSSADWLARAAKLFGARHWDDAGSAIERALSLDASSADGWYRLGNVREEQGRDAEAASCFEKTVALDPAHAKAWNNLGGARQRMGAPEPAIDAYRHSMAADPALRQPFLNLGRLYGSRGEQALAAACFSAALLQHPGDATFEHLLAAASGRRSAVAPQDYVTGLFDGIAAGFDRHLVRDLQYHLPEAMARLVRPALESRSGAGEPPRVLDLGCGTGLIGAALAGSGASVTGVDLSPRMLELAAATGAYARLVQGELAEVLARMPAGSLQAIAAADVFIYIGDLSAVFASAARALAPGGAFVFSVEALALGSYRLQSSGRYAQSPRYLRCLAARAGLRERHLERARIRCEGTGYAEGWIALFEKPGAIGA